MNILTRSDGEIAVGGAVGLSLAYVAHWSSAVPDWVGIASFLGFGIVLPQVLRERRQRASESS